MTQDLRSRHRGHFGLVAGMIDEMNRAVARDAAGCTTGEGILPISAVVRAMLLNGPGFRGEPPRCFRGIPDVFTLACYSLTSRIPGGVWFQTRGVPALQAAGASHSADTITASNVL